MTPLLLCAEMEKGKLMRLSFLAASMGIRMEEVQKNRQGETLGMLCGLDAAPSGGKAAGGCPEMMVMAFFSHELLDRLLREMRSSGMDVPLKAVLTPYNRAWTMLYLGRELQKEHAQMQERGKA